MKHEIGTKEKPMKLKTPPLTSEYTMHVDEKDGKYLPPSMEKLGPAEVILNAKGNKMKAK